MHCALIYNPVAGRERSGRAEHVRRVADILVNRGHSVELIATTAPGSAAALARDAADRGADVVFACGGDGTIHEVMQGLVSERGEPTATLGILPFGSANALARHLRISLDPNQAALQMIQGMACTIPIGRIDYGDQHRYFVVMAGAGPDGVLVYEPIEVHKAKFGRLAYYWHAARLFFTQRFPPFEVEYVDSVSTMTRRNRVVGVMAVRIGDLGGIFSKLADRNASIHDPHLRLLMLTPPAMLSLPLWFVLGWLNLHRLNPFLELVNVSGFSCFPSSENAPHVQADGEWLSRIPISVSVVPNAIRILIPSVDRPL